MHRQPLIKLLDLYRLKYPREEAMRRRITQFVQRHDNCFERSLLKGHITGSAWIVDRKLTRTLLTHHRKLNKWFQPGGHADGMSDIAAVALKEAREESGLEDLVVDSTQIFDIDVHLIPARNEEPDHYHYDCRFLVTCVGNEDFQVSEESHDLAWVPLADIRNYTEEESVLRMVEKTRHLV